MIDVANNLYLESITFNDDSEVKLKKNDIVIIVGPNNTGKSALLRELYGRIHYEGIQPPVIKILKEFILKKPTNKEDLKKALDRFLNNNGSYQGVGFSLNAAQIDYHLNNHGPLSAGQLAKYFIGFVNTEMRLKICEPAQSISLDQSASNPIHYLRFNKEYEDLSNKYFLKAFGTHFYAHPNFGSKIPLCMGDMPKLEKACEMDLCQLIDEKSKILNSFEQVQNQGDGIKSFVGILLYLIIDYYSMILVDEPEAFLHPPQAEIMGKMLGELLDNKQAFIATHSKEIIKGLITTCPERVKIIRLTRKKIDNKEINPISLLNSEQIKELWSDPLLKHSNILDSLFHSKVVLCESDADCKLYSTIEENIKQEEGKYSETLFIHCNGKARMPKIIRALKEIKVEVIVIPDIDIFADENDIKAIVSTMGGDWANIQKEYKCLISNIRTTKPELERENAKKDINDILDKDNSKTLSKTEIELLERIIKTTSPWGIIKKAGLSVIPKGDAVAAFIKIQEYLKSIGIYVVDAGELESFIPSVGGHGPDWVNTVLEKYPDLNDRVYNDVKVFIKSWDVV